MAQEQTKEISAAVTTSLVSADFHILPPTKEKETLAVSDSIEIKSASKNGFEIVFTRRVDLQPEGFFSILVCFSLRGAFSPESIEYYKNDEAGFGQWVKTYKERLLNDNRVVARSSALISSLSISAGLQPIVTPPSLVQLSPKENR